MGVVRTCHGLFELETDRDQRTLGSTGLSVSALGFGAAPIGFLAVEQQRSGDVLNLLLDSGVHLIDTAAAYAGSEESIGMAVGHRRDEYVLVSKCGQKLDGLPGEAWSSEVITAPVDRALRRLNPEVSTAIIGTTSPDNAKKNIEVASKGPLTDCAVAKIRAAFAEAGGNSWPALQ